MGNLDQLFGNSEGEDGAKADLSGFARASKPEWSNFDDLFLQHAGYSYEKQLLFGELIGKRNWEFDMKAGKLSFGDDLSFPVQVIGTLAFTNYSWMWGWGNEESGIPEALLRESYALKALGETKGIEELSDRHFSVGENFEHIVGSIACGVAGADAYYCANYGQGTLVVTLTDPEIPKPDRNDPSKVLFSFPQLVSAMGLDHRTAFKNYLIDRGALLREKEGKVEAIMGEKGVRAEFDEEGRLASLNGIISK